MAVRLCVLLFLTCGAFALNENEGHVKATVDNGDSGQILDRQLLLQLMDTVTSLKQENVEQSTMLRDMRSAMQRQQHELRKMETRLQKCEQLTQTRSETGENSSRANQYNRIELNPVRRSIKRDNAVQRIVRQGQGSTVVFSAVASNSENSFRKDNAVQRIVRQGQGSTVAFSAVASNSVNHYGAANSNIRFEKIDINIPSAYNPQTGAFTAPSDGIYVISASVLSVADRETSCDIVVNGNARARLYARGTDQRHGQGSQTVVFQLNGGDVVSVQNEAADDSVHGGLYTTFSGFLLPEAPSISSIIG